MTDTAHFLRRADLHSSFRHLHGSPEFILVPVRIREIDGGTLITLGGCSHRVRVRDLVAVEPSQVGVDVLGPDVKSASRRILAQLFAWRVDLGLKERADAARSTLPPQKAHYRHILFSCCS